MEVIVEDDHDERHLVSHDGFHQHLLEGLPVSPHSCREERDLHKLLLKQQNMRLT